jgi:hypothetical protein
MSVLAGNPYVADGMLYVVASEFMSFVNRDRIFGDIVKKRDFDDRLRATGFTCAPKPTFVRAKGRRIGRRYWSAPLGGFPFLNGHGQGHQPTEETSLGEGRVLPMAGYWQQVKEKSDDSGSEPAAN